MTNLQKNIDHYMDMKGIQFYSDLLIQIAHQLGIKGDSAYKFAEREKANFSKMLNGKRPLKYEFIIPLEKIFGVSLARLLDEDAYKLPVDKNNVPYTKGIRYYAYMNDYNLYERELDTFLTKNCKSSISCIDEFGKTFLDYVVEFGSINAVRFLRDKYKIKLRMWNNQFESSIENSRSVWAHNGIELARLVINSGDVQLFNDIYDPYYDMMVFGRFPYDSLWMSEDFAEMLLDNKDFLHSLYEERTYVYKLLPRGQKKYNRESVSGVVINPLINCCLNYALEHLDRYREEAKEILLFGIEHNKRIKEKLTKEPMYYLVDKCGGLAEYNYPETDMVGVVIVTDKQSANDKEIDKLINQLLVFNKF